MTEMPSVDINMFSEHTRTIQNISVIQNLCLYINNRRLLLIFVH